MFKQSFTHFLILFNIYISNGKENFSENSFYSKLIHHSSIPNVNVKREDRETNFSLKCFRENELSSKIQARFIDHSFFENNKVEAPAAKFSILNILSDIEEVKNQDEDDDDDYQDSKENLKTSNGDTEDVKEESLLKQYHRQSLRLHNLVFPLLLAYKLKFSMVIPLLLGSLVLLVGTTGVAGFFFALFAAAMGIHVKTQER